MLFTQAVYDYNSATWMWPVCSDGFENQGFAIAISSSHSASVFVIVTAICHDNYTWIGSPVHFLRLLRIRFSFRMGDRSWD